MRGDSRRIVGLCYHGTTASSARAIARRGPSVEHIRRLAERYPDNADATGFHFSAGPMPDEYRIVIGYAAKSYNWYLTPEERRGDGLGIIVFASSRFSTTPSEGTPMMLLYDRYVPLDSIERAKEATTYHAFIPDLSPFRLDGSPIDFETEMKMAEHTCPAFMGFLVSRESQIRRR